MTKRDVLGIAQVTIIISVLFSLFGREVLRGTALLGFCDVVSVFGGLSWLVVAVSAAAQDSHGESAGPIPEVGTLSMPERVASNPDVKMASTTEKAEAQGGGQVAKAAQANHLLLAVGVSLALFAFLAVFYEGLLIAPLLLAPFMVAYFGGRFIFRTRARLNVHVRTAIYLTVVIAAGWLWANGFRDISGKTLYLAGYAIEVALCLVAYTIRLRAHPDGVRAD